MSLNPFKRKKVYRISLSDVDFGMLVNGRMIKKSSADKNAEVQLILQDIGFDMMLKLVKAARGRQKKTNKRKAQGKVARIIEHGRIIEKSNEGLDK